MPVCREPLGDRLEAGTPEEGDRGVVGQVVRVVDLGRALDRALLPSRNQQVQDVDERVAVVGGHPPHRLEGAAHVEQVVNRLAEEHEIPPALGGIEVLGEAGDRLHAGRGGDGQLGGRRVEHRYLGAEGILDRAADEAGRATHVHHRPGRRVERFPQELDQLRGVGTLIVLHGFGIDPATVERADERAIDVLVERAVLGGGEPRREKAEAAATAHPERGGVAIAVAPGELNQVGRAAQIARRDRLGLVRRIVVADRSDPFGARS